METNGRNSCTGNSRHINVRYFFIKDQVDAKHLQIVYCPTEEMLADYFTKALQGKPFHRFRAVIMGWAHISTLQSDPVPSPPKERVGDVGESETGTNATDGATATPQRTYAQALTDSSVASSQPNVSVKRKNRSSRSPVDSFVKEE